MGTESKMIFFAAIIIVRDRCVMWAEVAIPLRQS